MTIKAGDMVKGAFKGGFWTGFVLDIQTAFSRGGDEMQVATIWRPELPAKQQIQTWPIGGQYQIEVIDEQKK
tara:strand:+ start:918 stop:1133 length:216 start_codon:yes stop_codon:yes gene_type:complete